MPADQALITEVVVEDRIGVTTRMQDEMHALTHGVLGIM